MKALSAKTVKLTIGRDWETPYLHILLTQEEDVVVARCLDFTVSSHGQNENQAIEALAEAIGEYIQSAIENDSIGQIYDPAYGKYWRMFNEEVAKDTGMGLYTLPVREGIPSFMTRNPRNPIQLSRMEKKPLF